MNTLPSIPPVPPTIPLTDELRVAYQHLDDLYEAEIENTTDPGVLQLLNDSQTDVDNILTKDAMYRIHADTALFEALQEQIESTNNDLETLKQQIASVASHFATANDILQAIDKIISIVSPA